MNSRYFSITILFFSLTAFCFLSGCKKTNPAPDPISDTPSVDTTFNCSQSTDSTHIKRLEEDYVQGNPNIIRRNRDYSFYYDSQERLIAVGIKNYGQVLFDTAASHLFYNNSSANPYKIITPNTELSYYGYPVIYDTTYLFYYPDGRLKSDSAGISFLNIPFLRKPLVRNYYYPGSTKIIIDWLYPTYQDDTMDLFRSDTLEHPDCSAIGTLTSVFNESASNGLRGNYAVSDFFSYSGYRNPLSNFNISGTPFSLLYTPVFHEVLGNKYHKALSNSNMLPYYLDFYSSHIPSSFYISGFPPGGPMNGGETDYFTIAIIPSVERPNYPSQITVRASTSFPGDNFVYRYYY